jgi:hypothetical protein
MSQGSLDYSGHYGGARPKNLEIISLRTRVLTQQDGDYTGRERSSSLTNSDENGISPLLRSQSVTGLPSNQSGSYGDLVEGFNKDSHSQTSESTINTCFELFAGLADWRQQNLILQMKMSSPEVQIDELIILMCQFHFC